MRKYVIYLMLFLCVKATLSQNFLNGDFEINTSLGDYINSPNNAFNTLMSDCNSFGNAGQIDIITTSNYGGAPQNGNWYVSLHGNFEDQLSMKLSSPLISGNCYAMTFYDRAFNGLPTVPFEIGQSQFDNNLGVLIYTTPSAPIIGTWTQRTYTFTAKNNGQYITVHVPGPVSNFIQIDNFSLVNLMPQISLGNDTLLCEGETLTLNATIPFGSYTWQDNSTDPTYIVTQPGIYWVNVDHICGNKVDPIKPDTITVRYNLLPKVNLGRDTVLCKAQTLLLNAADLNATYLWQDNSTNSTFAITQQGTYWVEVTNVCGAIKDSIYVEEINCGGTLEIPNVFTPNNDGVNDYFFPTKIAGIDKATLIIYNKWGQKLYESTDILVGWNGKDCSDGTYFWVVQYTTSNNESKTIQGFLTLIR